MCRCNGNLIVLSFRHRLVLLTTILYTCNIASCALYLRTIHRCDQVQGNPCWILEKENRDFNRSEGVGGDALKINQRRNNRHNFFSCVFSLHHRYSPYTIIQVFSPFTTCMEIGDCIFALRLHPTLYVYTYIIIVVTSTGYTAV